MKQPGQSEPDNERQWHGRLSALRQHPAPNLERGRARVLSAAQKRFPKTEVPRRAPLVVAFGVGLSVVLLMVIMSTTMGALSITRVAMTRTETIQMTSDATVGAPGAHSESPEAAGSFYRFGTPVPGAVPEPPRSPSVVSTLFVEP